MVLITGAGKGIGREAALLFAREGAKVAIAEIDAEIGNATKQTIEQEGGAAVFSGRMSPTRMTLLQP